MLTVSVLNVPADSGIYFLFAKKPAIATGPMIGKKSCQEHYNTCQYIPEILLSPKPSKPLPLLAFDEVIFIQHFREAMITGII